MEVLMKFCKCAVFAVQIRCRIITLLKYSKRERACVYVRAWACIWERERQVFTDCQGIHLPPLTCSDTRSDWVNLPRWHVLGRCMVWVWVGSCKIFVSLPMHSPVKYLVMSQLTNFLIKRIKHKQPLKITHQYVAKFYVGICMEVVGRFVLSTSVHLSWSYIEMQ